MTLGELFAVARECKGMTLRDLELKSGISNAVISQIETGRTRDPGLSTIVRLADSLDLSLERIARCVRANILPRRRGRASHGTATQ